MAPSGALERGYWTAAAADEVQPGRFVTAQIAFPIPLRSAITSANAHYLRKGQTVSGACEGTAIDPSVAAAAPNGTLCIYTGFEENHPTEYTSAITNAEFKPGTATTGTGLAFSTTEPGTANRFDSSGAWAVKAP
jgi:hypothetical protein